MYSIESKLHDDIRYVCHRGRQTEGGAFVPHSVLIRGRKGKHALRTSVSAEDHTWLAEDTSFRQHVVAGHLTIHVASPATPVLPQEETPLTESVEEIPAKESPETASPAETGDRPVGAREPGKAGPGKKTK